MLERYDQAMKDFDSAIRLDPENSFALKNRGDVYRMQRQSEQALSELNRANDQFALRGRVYFRLKTLKDIDRAIELEPENVA
ncbi:7648_t:CDS:2, partial [Ambispora leptoticha]